MNADTMQSVSMALGAIVRRVSRIDRDSKRAERTDLDAVWESLYAIKRDALGAIGTMGDAKAPAVLVVVSGGVAYTYATESALVETVDLDNVNAGDGPVTLPASFKALASEAGLTTSGPCRSVKFSRAAK